MSPPNPHPRRPQHCRPGRGKIAPRGRILLVEDHAPLARLRRDFFAGAGYETVCAADGGEAQRLLATQRFDIVVTDSALCTGSGWEVAADAKRRGLPVILSSGFAVRPAQIAHQSVDYICPKPCSLDQLLSLIEAALRKTRRQQLASSRAGTKSLPPKPGGTTGFSAAS